MFGSLLESVYGTLSLLVVTMTLLYNFVLRFVYTGVLSTYMFVYHVCVVALMARKVLDSLELELVMAYLVGAGIKPRSSGRVFSAINQAISPNPQLDCVYVVCSCIIIYVFPCVWVHYVYMYVGVRG